ncbi:MAG: dehypoxanthine futalosine cyclase [Calditerrivibrio sp.]|nr:dehypoxanthine futalosine cyclase [Calditerrivibrio sp.]
MLTFEDGIKLFEKDLLDLAEIANTIRKQKHPDGVVTFVIDRNINYTNICVCKCKFCAYYKDIQDKDAFVIDFDTLKKKIQETAELGGTQILLQGGLHPYLKIDFYEEMLRFIKSNFNIWIHGFSSPEIDHIAKISNLSIDETLDRLVKAGLDSIPGGGAELLVDQERSRISPYKIDSARWLGIMETAHKKGLKTTATMMFKKTDTPSMIIEHLTKIRDLQDKTGGFTAFIPWPFQPTNTELGGEKVSAVYYLKVLAISRIYLHNIDNIQVSWVTQGPDIGQIALYFGGNDFGSLMIEENVVAACGVSYTLSLEDILHFIKKAGFIPVQRDMRYNYIRRYD